MPIEPRVRNLTADEGRARRSTLDIHPAHKPAEETRIVSPGQVDPFGCDVDWLDTLQFTNVRLEPPLTKASWTELASK